MMILAFIQDWENQFVAFHLPPRDATAVPWMTTSGSYNKTAAGISYLKKKNK